MALVLLSFAHKPVDLSQPLLQVTLQSGSGSEQVFIRYETMADGSIVSICVSENSAASDRQHQHHTMMADCEACRISASFILNTPPAGAPLVASLAHNSTIKRSAPDVPRSTLYPPSAPPQAPPCLA